MLGCLAVAQPSLHNAQYISSVLLGRISPCLQHVLYAYRTVWDKSAPGGARFVPELIHNRSGVGSDVLDVDLNGDGAVDVVTSTRSGTYIFWGTTQGATSEEVVHRGLQRR